jgi:N-methylhydantoinase B/oxoprolinase/acetone carboxylase alpha subunit
LSFSHRGERHFEPAAGAAGGAAGACARSSITRRDGTEEVIPSKTVTRLAPGDRLVIETAGAGGYGPPEKREASAREADRANGKTADLPR